jgi:hypothetical protein
MILRESRERKGLYLYYTTAGAGVPDGQHWPRKVVYAPVRDIINRRAQKKIRKK